MASGLTSWQIDRETCKQRETFFWRGSKITADGVAAMKLKDACFLEKSYDQPRQHIKKQRHYLLTKVRLVKAMVFPIVMYGYESWTIKKAECRRIVAFELWYWRRKRQHTPVFLPGESQRWVSLVGCRVWGHTESDTTEAT